MTSTGTVRPDVHHLPEAPPAERDRLEIVAGRVVDFEQTVGLEFREANNRRYRQYRGFRKFADAWTTQPNDRDEVLYDAKKHWGAHLHIPLSYRTIETQVPRAIAQRPRMLYLPRREADEPNVRPVSLLIDAQQDNIDIDLPFQAIMRAGKMYGLGVGKSYWRKEQALYRPVRRSMLDPRRFVTGDLSAKVTFDDPMFEDVDVYDFMWDPYGSSVETCEWLVHRVWMSTAACLQRIRTGVWNTESAKALTEEKLEGLGGGQRQVYDEVWSERMEASGFFTMSASGFRGKAPHEILEYHDGERVLTVIDRQVLVQDQENPCLGHKPFVVYRPTPLQRQMVGIGDLEPIEHLNRELDTLRSQRRDAATLALCAGYAFDDGAIEETDLVFGPRAGIRVTGARPSDALMPLRPHDVPGVAFQEESVIKSDIDVVTGIQDESPGQVTTATEAQLVQASLSLRIQLSSRRFELEVVRNAARQFLYLNQRMILKERPGMRIPAGPDPENPDASRWEWFKIAPPQLQGEFTIIPEGGSMAQRNIPQDRQDAQTFLALSNNPLVNGRMALLKSIELLGIKDPEGFLAQPNPQIPAGVIDILHQMGVDEKKTAIALEAARRNDATAPLQGQGPNVEQVDQMMQTPEGVAA